jgi:hypothetical protein
VNIVISLLIWRYAATQISGLATDIILWLRTLFDARPGGSKLIPV